MIGLITLIVILIQVLLLIFLIKEYIYNSKEIISDDDFYQIIKSQEINLEELKSFTKETQLWLKKILFLIQKKQSYDTIENLIKSIYKPTQDKLTLYSNLGPAIGLLFTFLGMIITIWYIGSTKIQSINQVKNAISHLSPVFVGSLLGILVYSIGIFLKRRFDEKVKEISDTYLNIYFQLYEKNFDEIPKDIEDAYHQLLLSFSGLKKELNSIRSGFSDFAIKLEQNNEQFEENTKSIKETILFFVTEIKNIVQETINNTQKLLDNISDYNKSYEHYSEKVDSYINQLEKVTSPLLIIMEKSDEFSKSFNKLNETINLLLETSNGLQGVSDILSKNKDDLRLLINQFDKYLLEIKGLLQLQTSIKSSFEEFNNKLPSNEISNISLYLKEITENINSFKSLEEKLHKYIDNNDSKLNGISETIFQKKNIILTDLDENTNDDPIQKESYAINKINDTFPNENINDNPTRAKGSTNSKRLLFNKILSIFGINKRNKNE